MDEMRSVGFLAPDRSAVMMTIINPIMVNNGEFRNIRTGILQLAMSLVVAQDLAKAINELIKRTDSDGGGDENTGVPRIDVTPEMINAGEEVLDRAFLSADLAPSWTIYAAVKDVYIAMHQMSDRGDRENEPERDALSMKHI